MTIPTLKELVSDFRAWRRGEKRVAPYGSRGRVYEKKSGNAGSGPSLNRTKAEPKATLHMKIMRADGTIEHRSVPATVTKEVT